MSYLTILSATVASLFSSSQALICICVLTCMFASGEGKLPWPNLIQPGKETGGTRICHLRWKAAFGVYLSGTPSKALQEQRAISGLQRSGVEQALGNVASMIKFWIFLCLPPYWFFFYINDNEKLFQFKLFSRISVFQVGDIMWNTRKKVKLSWVL